MRIRRLLALLAGLGLLGGGAALVLRPQKVSVVRPEIGPVRQTVVVSGQVMPPAEIRLASLVSSSVQEVLAREGQQVEEGQVLVRLDDADARAGVAQAEATLAAARAGRTELLRLSAPEAETALRRAETKLQEAHRRLKREQNLFDAGVTTEAMLDEAKTAEQLAQAERQGALLQLRAASAGGTRGQSAKANIALAEAQLSRAKVQLSRHVVRAPTDGVVISRAIEPGDAVFSGSNLFLLSATGDTRLRVEPDERNLALLELGQVAVASAEAFPGKRFEAKVSYIAPAVDPDRGTVEVRLLVDASPDFLRQNMTISVEITVAQKAAALLIPRSSVLAEKTAPHVLSLVDGHAKKTPVSLGLLGDDAVEIESGISQEDLVIRAPQGSVVEGDALRAESAKRASASRAED